jgi:photosystem II stability/assembly factor-like uncharacterized protein
MNIRAAAANFSICIILIIFFAGCEACNEQLNQPPDPTNQPDAIILRSSNGGLNWLSNIISSPEKLNSVTSLNDTELFSAGVVGDIGCIVTSRNSGQSWSRRNISGYAGELKSLLKLTDSKLIVLCSETFFDPEETIFISTNKGADWIKTISIKKLNSMYFYTSLEGVCVGDLGLIYRTTNGGYNWEQSLSPAQTNLLDISFYDHLGIAVGEIGRIIKTTDGGETWTQINNVPTQQTLRGVEFVDNTKIVAVGTNGTILRSSDGGETWFNVEAPVSAALYDIAFYYSKGTVLVAAGAGGTIIRSTNLGITWSMINGVTTRNLYGVYFDNYGDCFIAGE